ncbi:hypothetical protein [Yinghuangia soli]|uniref:DNA-binding protein n=1 Tax=Yinghuangia soli TaxID=2908204 RepID=A0AA41Q916_9ACTN|nr:hypothetical protein [Yinghuangia soli]MCF2532569.1 hypothetical protein [Yinghuangia soli]
MTAEPTTPGTTPRTALDPAEAAVLLDAGAVLLPGSAQGDDVDTLTARTYTHPGLDDRAIVRLVPATLGDAEDLALDFLGLVRGAEPAEVGQVRRETLGFPAWALVNDPANGHHALALVRDIERLDRQARSKPGSAKEGFDALGTKLGRAVPHFLPTFYEQAARIFLGHENTTYAATFFGKAREAERVHNLRIEEARLRAVFLEFAFAGALTAKALKEYAKDLSRRLDPPAAWQQFRQLCVERCAAGMPPYAGLAEDCRAMIRAVGGGADAQGAEERALLVDLLPGPAIERAPLSFWKAFAKSLAVLAAERPEVRSRLLEIFPTPGSGEPADVDAYWIGLLAATGADSLLTTPGALESGKAAAWLSRWARHIRRGWRSRPRDAATVALAERMAPALIADGVSVDLASGNWRGEADPDLLDVCLAHGVQVTAPKPDASLDFGSWFEDTAPGRRDLAALGAAEVYGPVLKRSIGRLGAESNGRHVAAAAAQPVLKAAMHSWLEDRVAELETQAGLPGAQEVLSVLDPFRTVAADVHPGAVARVRAVDAAPILARTLRAGIPDELAWPALEDGLAALGFDPAEAAPGLAPGGPDLEVSEAWPALIVSTGSRVVVVGPQAVLLDHELRIPDKLDRYRKPRFRYIDGDLLVMWWTDNDSRAYWSSRPAEIFEPSGAGVPGRWGGDQGSISYPHPDGGRVTGARTMHAGDTEVAVRRPVMTDGRSHWVYDWNLSLSAWVEYDPATGTQGRASLPGPFAAVVEDPSAGSLMPGECQLLPMQPGLEDTPLGTDGNVLGRWVRIAQDTVTASYFGGEPVTMPIGDRQWDGRPRTYPMGVLKLPGGARPAIVSGSNSLDWYDGGIRLFDFPVERSGGDQAAGTRLLPGLSFWHAMRPRDEASSAVLRGITDADATALIAGAEAEYKAAQVEAVENEKTLIEPVPMDSVRAVLPGLAHPGLVAGAAGFARTAARLTRRLASFGTPPKTASAGNEPYRPEHGTDGVLVTCTEGFAERLAWQYRANSQGWGTLNQIRATAALLAPEADAADGPAATEAPATEAAATEAAATEAAATEAAAIEDLAAGSAGQAWTCTRVDTAVGSFDWTGGIGRSAPYLVRAASPFTAPEQREALLLLVEELAAEAFHRPGTLRRVILCAANREGTRVGEVHRRGDRTVVIVSGAGWGEDRKQHWLALDHDPSGQFAAVAHFATHDAHLVEYTEDREHILRLVAAIRASGPVAWRPEAAAAFAEATTARSAEALFLCAGLPGLTERLATEQRELLGLKAAELDVARDRMRALGGPLRELLAALVPADADSWWTEGHDVAAAAAVWNRHFGDVVRLPEDLATEATAARIGDSQLEPVLNPGTFACFTRTTVQRLDKDGTLTADDPAAVPAGQLIANCAAILRWLAYRLPYGHPLRASLPRAVAAMRTRLADPGLLLDCNLTWTDRGTYVSKALRESEGLAETGGADADGMLRIREAMVLTPWYGEIERVWLRPAALTGPDDPDLQLLAALSGSRADALEGVRTVLGDSLDRLLDAGADGPLGWAQDPSWSVPDLVAEVAKVHEIGADAAALYLQLLALPDPTDRNQARWTGWKPARLKAARAELGAGDLVVTAKRARAGRSLFLPGGWHEFKTALPLETWKDGLYPVADHYRLIPDRPVTDLFRSAWQRVQEGDAPGFEQLETRTTRRGRRR